MRKLFTFIPVLALCLGLWACGSETAPASTAQTTQAPAGLQVGYGRVCITPEHKAALSSSQQATYTGVYEDVYLTCIALTDAKDETVLMVTVDVSYTSAANQRTLLRAASEATGVPESHISYSCTHNHSGLEPSGTVMSMLKKAIAQCAQEAMDDRAPATLEVGSCYPEGFNFVRHYQTEDGDWVGDNYYSQTGKKAATAERKADNTMQLMHFVRPGKQNVLLLNWQAHGTYTYHMEFLCTDFVGPLRDEVAQKTGALVAYFQGAAGNLNPVSNLGDNKFDRSLEGVTQYGTALAHYPIEAMSQLKPVDASAIAIEERSFTATVRKDPPELVLAAATYRQVREAGGSHAEAVAATGDLLHGDQGAEYVGYRATQDPTVPIVQRVVRLGDVAFVIAPYEMFDDTGVYIRQGSPFEMTFILGYTNGRNGYIPSAKCIEHGCYEFEGSYFAPGTAEALAEEYLAMLTQLHDQQ